MAFNNKWNRELFGAGLDFSYNRDSTLVTEANDQIVENVGRGTRDVVKNRESLVVQPTFSYALSERLIWQNSFLYNDVAYIDAAATGLIDYSYWQAQTGLSFQWKYNVSVFSDLRYSVFEVP
ncbi:MAG: hypothetical protein IPG43_23435 [Proteobacteria bacterium]|nr:hypothetical protein [Pseudomonadota bacterium]